MKTIKLTVFLFLVLTLAAPQGFLPPQLPSPFPYYPPNNFRN
jgi:hypothetical protein